MNIKDCIKWNKVWKLTFIEFVDRSQKKHYAKYLCDCGAIKEIRVDAVGYSVFSCSCEQKEKSSIRLKSFMNNPENKEFVSAINRTHGMKKTSEYRIWAWIKNRTWDKPHWKGIHYKKKWITMCDEWRTSFEKFYQDMWPRPAWMSIDRIDNNGNYEPWNCKWSTVEEQNNNTSRNVFLEYNWERKTIRQWTKHLWINRMYFHNRKNLWYDFQTTLNTLLCAAE